MPMSSHMGGPAMIPQGVSGPMSGNPGGNLDRRFMDGPQGAADAMQ